MGGKVEGGLEGIAGASTDELDVRKISSSDTV